MNTLIKSIQEFLGNESSLDDFGPEKYAGSEVADELLALDDMDNTEVAMESITETTLGLALMEQEAALESAGLGITEFNRYNGELGTESLANMAKRGGYNVIIAIKKALSKIWKFIETIIDFFTICDGRWKSYSKLAKKYRTKMNQLKMHTGENDADKEYSIHNVEHAARCVSSLSNRFNNFRVTTPTGASPETYARAAIDEAGRILYLCQSFGVIIEDGDQRDTAAFNSNNNLAIFRAAMDVDGDGWKERFENLKEELKDAEEILREVEDRPVNEAKRMLSNALSRIENATRRDVKWIKQYKKAIAGVQKAIDKLGGENPNRPGATQEDIKNDLLDKMGIVLQMLVETKKTVNLTFKAANSTIQMILADAAKVIAGETRIGD